MKIAFLLALASTVHAFAPTIPQRASVGTSSRMAASDFGSAMPDISDPYARIGVEKDKLALGLDANEVLEWVGTREDIVEKFLADNNQFTRERAEMEVDKFLMDAEMVTAYMTFQKNKDSMSLEEESGRSSVIDIYLPWIIGYLVFSSIRTNYIEPKYASGEWTFNPFGLFGGRAPDAVDAVPAAVEGAASSVAAVQSAIDAVSDMATSAM